MYNLYAEILNSPNRCQKLTCGESLISIFNCKLENRYQDLWSHHNYFVYVIEGRKVWHTSNGSYDLCEGSCVFVRKGGAIVEQFFDTEFCFFLFFLPDDFICDVLKSKSTPMYKSIKRYDPVIAIDNTPAVQIFFQSMLPHFDAAPKPDRSLLELKFRELILIMAGNPANNELIAYFYSLLSEPQTISLQCVMENNFCFNLKLEEFAKLSARSLSAFKRDFVRFYNTSPGKWLMEKRLNHAMHMLTYMGKTVSETAFESGFENASHFSRAFRQRFGHCPAAIKQNQDLCHYKNYEKREAS